MDAESYKIVLSQPLQNKFKQILEKNQTQALHLPDLFVSLLFWSASLISLSFFFTSRAITC